MPKAIGFVISLALSAVTWSGLANASMVMKATFSCNSGRACVATVTDYGPEDVEWLTQGTCTWLSTLTVTRVDFEIFGTSPAATFWLMPHVVSAEEDTAKGFYVILASEAARRKTTKEKNSQMSAIIRDTHVEKLSL